MELGGNGGFHGYRRQLPQQTSSGMAMGMMMNQNDVVIPDMNMNIGLPCQTNHIPILHHHNNINNSSSSSPTPENQEHQNDQCIVREQDRFMPIANVIRIMRKVLPPHAKISDDAKETIQECVSEYISFITGEANERCQREQRKTITAEDVLWAMSKLGFDDYVEPLTLYLHRYREYDGGDRGSLRGDPHSLTMKRPAVDPPAGGYHGPPVFHHLPPRHPGATFYGVMPMNGGGPQGYHFKVDPSSGGSTSHAAMTPKSNGSQDPFAPAPKE